MCVAYSLSLLAIVVFNIITFASQSLFDRGAKVSSNWRREATRTHLFHPSDRGKANVRLPGLSPTTKSTVVVRLPVLPLCFSELSRRSPLALVSWNSCISCCCRKRIDRLILPSSCLCACLPSGNQSQRWRMERTLSPGLFYQTLDFQRITAGT